MADTAAASEFPVTIARIETKIDRLIQNEGDHETRIRALESRRWPLATVNTLLSLAAVVVSLSAMWR